jgi:hypothetical protein
MTAYRRTSFAVASLLPCAAAAVLWARSYLVHDAVAVTAEDRVVPLHSVGGRFVVDDQRFGFRFDVPQVMWFRGDGQLAEPGSVLPSLVRFDSQRYAHGRSWSTPEWPALATAALAPAWLLRRRRAAAAKRAATSAVSSRGRPSAGRNP